MTDKEQIQYLIDHKGECEIFLLCEDCIFMTECESQSYGPNEKLFTLAKERFNKSREEKLERILKQQ